MGDIEKRLENLEHLAAAEPEQQPDLLLTAHEEQWERGPDDVLVPVKRQIIGYTETVWGSPGRNGGRIGHRRALYAGRPAEQLRCRCSENPQRKCRDRIRINLDFSALRDTLGTLATRQPAFQELATSRDWPNVRSTEEKTMGNWVEDAMAATAPGETFCGLQVPELRRGEQAAQLVDAAFMRAAFASNGALAVAQEEFRLIRQAKAGWGEELRSARAERSRLKNLILTKESEASRRTHLRCVRRLRR